jgi:hypothetical protein
MTTHEELEQLAAAIYNEVCRAFREEMHYDVETICPFTEQAKAVSQAYIRGAVVANTLVINNLARKSSEVLEQ